MGRYLQIAFIILCIFALSMYSVRESFTLRDGADIDQKMLLADWYPVKKPDPELSHMSMDKQYVNYPIFPAHSQNINNLKQWRKPNNGRCVPPDLCGEVYDDRKIVYPQQPKVPGFNDGTRVNYYNVC